MKLATPKLHIEHAHDKENIGISIAVTVYNKLVYLAFAFQSPLDKFNRKRAVQILNGRLYSKIFEERDVKYVYMVGSSEKDAFSIMKTFRQAFHDFCYELTMNDWELSPDSPKLFTWEHRDFQANTLCNLIWDHI